MNVTIASVDYLVLVVYAVLLLAFGFYMSKKQSGDIFLGGRSLNWWEIGFSLFSANAGPTMLIGFASIGFSQGVVGSNFEWWLGIPDVAGHVFSTALHGHQSHYGATVPVVAFRKAVV